MGLGKAFRKDSANWPRHTHSGGCFHCRILAISISLVYGRRCGTNICIWGSVVVYCGIATRRHDAPVPARILEKVYMASTIEETPITRKTRELCQAILDEPSVKSLRQQIDTFMADTKAREQYDGLVAKGQTLQEKQQNAVALTNEEISDFEQHRESLLKNPVARGFLDAQHELHHVQESIHKFVNKTFELGRLPSEQDLEEGCCGNHGCGCSH